MTLRARIALLTAGAVAVAVVAVSLGSWLLMRSELRRQVDLGLEQRAVTAVRAAPAPFERRLGERAAFAFGLDNAVQVVDVSGRIVREVPGPLELPVRQRDQEVAAGTAGPYLHDERVDGDHLRVITVPLRRGFALQVARSLAEVDGTLRGMAVVLGILTLLGAGGASVVGLLVARGALAPVGRLTSAAEHVARTKELDASIDVDRSDELGRLARSFNEMLAALSESKEQQRRLVSDASHELRTPLTSLRTNIEVLARQRGMKPAERERLLADVTSELEELSALVGELVELATEAKAVEEEVTDVRLDEVVAAAVERARRRSGRQVRLDAHATVVAGRPLALERAVGCVLDNATKWGPPGEPIDVTVRDARVEVRDRGPGIAPADRERVFDRFHRATAARSMPGSGLGLAIAKQVADAHGGRVWAEEPDGPGALVVMELPAAPSRGAPDPEADS